jgi:hypothetical protein
VVVNQSTGTSAVYKNYVDKEFFYQHAKTCQFLTYTHQGRNKEGHLLGLP